MKSLKKLSVLILFFSNCVWADVSSPVGFWETKDDEGGKESAIIEIVMEEGTLQGRIVDLINTPNKNALCEKCTGENKDKPILGLKMIWDLEQKSEKWTNGFILDPKSGKEYRCNLQLKNEGQELKVRGYIGFSLIGRTQTWKRTQR